jgi:hypothetical protein
VASRPVSSRGSTSWRGVSFTTPPHSASSRASRSRGLGRVAFADDRAQAFSRVVSSRTWAWRSAAVAVQQPLGGGAGAPRPGTAASFQARLATSRTPWHMPWPRKGGCMWAASPAMNTRPAPALGHQRVEAVGWTGATACRRRVTASATAAARCLRAWPPAAGPRPV